MIRQPLEFLETETDWPNRGTRRNGLQTAKPSQAKATLWIAPQGETGKSYQIIMPLQGTPPPCDCKPMTLQFFFHR